MSSYFDDVETHYPMVVLQRIHTDVDELNSELYALIKQMAEEYGDTPDNAVNEGLVSTQGGYQTSTRTNLLTLKAAAIETFRETVLLPACHAYLTEVFGDEAAELSPWPVGWANLLQTGDWQGPHWHPTDKNIASGVYYVHLPDDMPAPEGHIHFLNPMPQSVNHGYPATRRLTPVPGKLVMFPPWYTHYVHPFKGEGERAIIAFDVLAQKPGLDLVF
ncbi:MAG: putative 2OG-Fe(II) oxygenase [Pseudomonadota bacterium]